MKYFLPIAMYIVFIISPQYLFATGKSEDKPRDNTLIVISYDSFVSEWGLGPQIQQAFTEKYGYEIELISYGDAIETFNTLKNLDPSSPNYPDVMVGIDNNMAHTVLTSKVMQSSNLSEESLNAIPSHLFLDNEDILVPFDYGYISIVYDSDVIQDPPTSLEALTDPRFKDSLILIDPRSSSPGLAFFLWTVDVYGDDFIEYWERLKPSILSIPNGWSVAYGIFTTGEAPLVLSYTTSPAYHIEYEDKDNIKSIVFQEGNYLQIEYMGITQAAPNPQAAQDFLTFMLSDEVQDKIALTNIMYPVKQDTELPQSFASIKKPDKERAINPSDMTGDSWLTSKIEAWEELMSTK